MDLRHCPGTWQSLAARGEGRQALRAFVAECRRQKAEAEQLASSGASSAEDTLGLLALGSAQQPAGAEPAGSDSPLSELSPSEPAGAGDAAAGHRDSLDDLTVPSELAGADSQWVDPHIDLTAVLANCPDDVKWDQISLLDLFAIPPAPGGGGLEPEGGGAPEEAAPGLGGLEFGGDSEVACRRGGFEPEGDSGAAPEAASERPPEFARGGSIGSVRSTRRIRRSVGSSSGSDTAPLPPPPPSKRPPKRTPPPPPKPPRTPPPPPKPPPKRRACGEARRQCPQCGIGL